MYFCNISHGMENESQESERKENFENVCENLSVFFSHNSDKATGEPSIMKFVLVILSSGIQISSWLYNKLSFVLPQNSSQ